ncbi:MAG: lysophospholipid acyltransferase family protein [Opitutaceae bacterium]
MPKNKSQRKNRYRGPVKWIVYILARALITAFEAIPISSSYRIGRTLGYLCWKFMAKRRGTVRKNLEIVNAWLSAEQPNHEVLSMTIEEQVREVFQRSGANLFCGFAFTRMSVKSLSKHLELSGLDELQKITSAGDGVILLLGHMGPWEALNHLPGLAREHEISAPFGAIFRPLNNRYLDDWYKAKRGSSGTSLFSHKDGFSKPTEFLRNGGMLGIFSDQKLKRGPVVSFFGKDTPTTPLPGILQRRSDCQIFRLAIYTKAPKQWAIELAHVKLPEDKDIRGRESDALLCNQHLEISLSQGVLDGFWFHRRF